MVSKIPNDVFQFSTVSALMAGLVENGPSAGQLTGYGTHGIGTFSNLEGELLYMDGKAYQMTAERGVQLAPSDISLPFVQVTKFIPEFSGRVSGSLKKDDLMTFISQGGSQAGGGNSFMPISISGRFKSIRVRVAGPRRSPDETLVSVTERAEKSTLIDVKGSMFGFVSPGWSQGISVAGQHLHFVSEPDANGTLKGGHMLDFEADDGARVDWAVTGRYHLGMPRGEEWESLDLTADAAGIKKAES